MTDRLSTNLTIVFWFAVGTFGLGLLTNYYFPNGYSKLSILIGILLWLCFGIFACYEMYNKKQPLEAIK